MNGEAITLDELLSIKDKVESTDPKVVGRVMIVPLLRYEDKDAPDWSAYSPQIIYVLFECMDFGTSRSEPNKHSYIGERIHYGKKITRWRLLNPLVVGDISKEAFEKVKTIRL
jgi:hypothetical protein